MRLHRGSFLFELVGFFGNSLIALLADVSIFSLLTWAGVWPFAANVISSVIAATITYLLSTRFTFRMGTAWSTYLGYVLWTLFVIALFSFLIQLAITASGWPAPVWKVLFAPVSFVFNFLFSRALFRRHQKIVSLRETSLSPHAADEAARTTLQVVMPMAGRGSRFASAGWTTPKPLIEVDGMPMFMRALSSLDHVPLPRRVTLVVQQSHIDEYDIDVMIRDVMPDAVVVALPGLTRGAAETALAAASYLDPDLPLVVMDCDLWFSSDSYTTAILASRREPEPFAGGLLTFASSDPRYSFAEIDGERVTRTAEKVAISDRAITGAYFFTRARYFTEATTSLLNSPLEAEAEYYMSSVYNVMIAKGQRISWSSIDDFASFGTPEELNAHEQKGSD